MSTDRPLGAALDVLHIIPRFIGGGPERSLLAYAAWDRRAGIENRHKVIVLEAPVSLAMLLAARRAKVELIVRPKLQAIEQFIEAADVVQIHFWNHPALTSLLRTVPLPPARVLLWSRVLGTRAPQVLTEEIACFGDYLLLTSRISEESRGVLAARNRARPVHYMPGIADMSRLEGFRPKAHCGTCVGYIGLVSSVKMHERFAELCAAVRSADVRFVVCGGGGGEDELRARFLQIGLGERADIRGHVEEVRGALEEFDVFGYPLVEDTYATSEKALQEAMWVGIPPVVFPHGGVKALVEHERTGIVVTTDEAYASAVERLAEDVAYRQRLGYEARRFARHEFSPDRWCRELNRVMSELMDEPRRSRSPLEGADESAAANFVRGLGDQAGPFKEDCDGTRRRTLDCFAEADVEIAQISLLTAFGEGGVVHYHKAFPGDPDLRRWAELVARFRSSWF